jgi:tRNA threonylcarbamoyladenosine biosynthesis protein TsaE
MQTNVQQYRIKDISDLDHCIFTLNDGDTIFFYGDLGSGKTTFIRKLLQNHFKNPDLIVRSPTYTYYTQYESITHFDLYRIEEYDEFLSIGGMEIRDQKNSICLIEWPELLEWTISPTKIVHIHLQEDMSRFVEITTISDNSIDR